MIGFDPVLSLDAAWKLPGDRMQRADSLEDLLKVRLFLHCFNCDIIGSIIGSAALCCAVLSHADGSRPGVPAPSPVMWLH